VSGCRCKGVSAYAQAQDAVDFIIETIHRYPHEVTILEIAPPTNLALAIRKDPTIVPLIEKLVTMAGQMFVPGNAYLETTAFASWFIRSLPRTCGIFGWI
jgi:inosine-uridine nucleoside N-ribohydrolase